MDEDFRRNPEGRSAIEEGFYTENVSARLILVRRIGLDLRGRVWALPSEANSKRAVKGPYQRKAAIEDATQVVVRRQQGKKAF